VLEKWWRRASLLALILLLTIGSAYAVYYFEPEQGDAIQASKDARQKEAVDILASERVSYYTKVLAIFTGALSAFGIIQVYFLLRTDANVLEQLRLSRREFEASHRPWMAIRDATLKKGGVALGALQVEISIEYKLENTSDVPALDLLFFANIIPANEAKHIDELQQGWVQHYEKMSKTTVPKDQNQVVFPHALTTYTADPAQDWRNFEEKTEWAPEWLSDVLIVGVFIYVNAVDRADFKTSTCVHRITSEISAGDAEIAKAGTDILKDGRISIWRTGWNAT
jgi:hypothetical protein